MEMTQEEKTASGARLGDWVTGRLDKILKPSKIGISCILRRLIGRKLSSFFINRKITWLASPAGAILPSRPFRTLFQSNPILPGPLDP